jgi:hypothetical protein
VRTFGLALAVAALPAAATAQQPLPASLNTLHDIGAALRACWKPPQQAQARAGMQITVQLAFKRNGDILGKPRITFETKGASEDERFAYRLAVAQMIERCAPLPFTTALGNAVAGRPFTMRFVDNRKLKQAEMENVQS